jgi:hypothetical protein
VTSSSRTNARAIFNSVISIGIFIGGVDGFEILLSFWRIYSIAIAVILLLFIEILLKESILLCGDCLLNLETICISFLVFDNLIPKLIHLLEHLERFRKVSNIGGISAVVALSLFI